MAESDPPMSQETGGEESLPNSPQPLPLTLNQWRLSVLRQLPKNIYNAFYATWFTPFTQPFHWRRTPVLYINWLFRIGFVIYYYQSWMHPVETAEWVNEFDLRAKTWEEGMLRWTGLLKDGEGVGYPQPREDWELLSPKHLIWREEIAWVAKGGRREEEVKEEFLGWTQSWEDFDMKTLEDEGAYAGLGKLDATERVAWELTMDGVWKEGMEYEDWVKRVEIMRYIELLQDEWDISREHKKWYIITEPDTAPIPSSVVFFLSRFDSQKAYYFSFDTTSILSASAMEQLMETDAFYGLSLVKSSKDEVEPSFFERLKLKLGLSRGKLLVTSHGTAPSFPDAVLQAAAKRRNIEINTTLQHLFSPTAPQWTHITPWNHCQIILGFHNLSPSDYPSTCSELASDAAPAWPLRIEDIWTRLGGFPSWEGMYGTEDSDGWGYFGKGGWDNVGPTSSNKTRLVYEYWGEEYAEYDDGSWSVVQHEVWSGECQEYCYEGGLREPIGTHPLCLAYKEESLLKNGEVAKTETEYREKGSGLRKCTFVPWKVVGEKNEMAWTMVNDLAVENEGCWRECEDLDARQLVGLRVFPPGGGTGCDTFACQLQDLWDRLRRWW